MRTASPLRYPGGKWRLLPYFERLIKLNFEQPPAYIEPYAGGASLALSLLFSKAVSDVFLNDLDPAIYATWKSILDQPSRFVSLLEATPVTPEEWRRQKDVYRNRGGGRQLAFGFATFYLNRTSHSGILNGGMIGGNKQSGAWKLDARFNKRELVQRVLRISAHRSRIHLSGADALVSLKAHRRRSRALVYLDPPYHRHGRDLYMNAYRPSDHALVRDAVFGLKLPWIVSYDDVPEVRALYSGVPARRVLLRHNARESKEGHEILFFSRTLRIPRVAPYSTRH